MIVFKGFLIILVIVTSSLIGNIKANSFGRRYLELKKFKNALGIFRSKLEFTYEPINEIFRDISKLVYEDENNIFKSFIEKENWNIAIEEQKQLTRRR